MPATGGRVRNAYATCLKQGDKPGKLGLIPRIVTGSHGLVTKALGRFEMGMRGIR